MTTSAGAVFLSYASEDVDLAAGIAAALKAAGVEVWFDRSDLRGGDAWDRRIRQQIKTCRLFVPLVSNHTEARGEGYFRLEWKLAIDRSHLMAPDQAFLLPVAVDHTPVTNDRVPERFHEVQWITLARDGSPTALVDHILALLGSVPPQHTPNATPAVSAVRSPPAPAPRGRPGLVGAGLLVGLLLAVASFGGWYLHHARSARPTPYSAADARMSFAVLPFQSPPNDPHAVEVANATADAFSTVLESDTIWARTAARAAVVAASSRHPALPELAQALNVHFLIRGTLAHTDKGYDVNLATIDGATEHVLGTYVLKVAGTALTPRWKDDIWDAVGHLVFTGLGAEVAASADRAPADLDVRDLSFRAFHTWAEAHGDAAKHGYETASALLTRALALAPDDSLANSVMAEINLCNCVMAWSQNVDVQKEIGFRYLEKAERLNPNDPGILLSKAQYFSLKGRLEEALVLTDRVLAREPDYSDGLFLRVILLARTGHTQDALTIVDRLDDRYDHSDASVTGLAAYIHFMTGDDVGTVQLARRAIAGHPTDNLARPLAGPLRLVLAAAEARLGHKELAAAALADFGAAVPKVKTLSAMRQWIYPTIPLYGFEPLFAGLKLAGVPD